jgi:hypothetical protein
MGKRHRRLCQTPNRWWHRSCICETENQVHNDPVPPQGPWSHNRSGMSQSRSSRASVMISLGTDQVQEWVLVTWSCSVWSLLLRMRQHWMKWRDRTRDMDPTLSCRVGKIGGCRFVMLQAGLKACKRLKRPTCCLTRRKIVLCMVEYATPPSFSK